MILPTALHGIIGYPLGHTMSPLVHNTAFAACAPEGVYLKWPLVPEKLGDFVTSVRTLPIRGVSITIPHKETVIPLLDGITDRARRIGAVNTLYWDNDRLMGENTDITGFLSPLSALEPVESALILGAGGAARAVVAGLQEWGVASITITNRTKARADDLAAEFSIAGVEWDARSSVQPVLVVNTTPLGMQGEREALSPWQQEWFAPGMMAYDLVYNPLETRFLAQAKAAGCRTIDGLTMFTGQAKEQFRLWTGLELDEAVAREQILATLTS